MSLGKRKAADYSENEQPELPALKKQKMNTKLPLFHYDCTNVDVDRTLNELKNIPKHWNKYLDKELKNMQSRCEDEEDYLQYFRNKFYVASNIRTYNNHIPDFEPIPFLPIPFMDKKQNICLIVEYDDKQIIDKMQRKIGNKCKMEIYDNSKGEKFNIDQYRFYSIKYQHYVMILRTSYSNFIQNYHHSFREFLIHKKMEFFTQLLIKYSSDIDSNRRYGVIEDFKDFFIMKIEPFGYHINNVFAEYHNAFKVYCDCYDFKTKYIIPFTVLWELFDIQRRKETAESIKCGLNKIGKLLNQNIEQIATGFIMQFLYSGQVKPYCFEDFFVEQLALKIEYVQFYENKKLGKYTQIYEWDNWKKTESFCLNPFKFKFLLNDEQLKFVKDILKDKHPNISNYDQYRYYDSWKSIKL